MIDIGGAARTESVPAHGGPVWSLAALPDNSGASSDTLPHNGSFALVPLPAGSFRRHPRAAGRPPLLSALSTTPSTSTTREPP